MEEGAVKERPSESRIREAVALDGVTAFVVACPKDITMYRDAVKTTGQESRLVVKDLIELVHEAMSRKWLPKLSLALTSDEIRIPIATKLILSFLADHRHHQHCL